MPEAVIVDAVRTPTGRRNGKLRSWHAADLAGHLLEALAHRNELDVGRVDDVIMGCVMQVGQQALNVGRNAVLAAGWPDSVPATTVDRQCGSSQQAIHFAAQGVMAGAYDLVVAAGVESMSNVPMFSNIADESLGHPYPESMQTRYSDTGLPPQGIGAELIADEYGITRAELDAFATESQIRAHVATDEGRFETQIVPVEVTIDGTVEEVVTDEGIRPDTTVDILGRLEPAFIGGGKVTAGNSSQISDGAAAVLIASEERAEEMGLIPRARFEAFALAGTDPVTMLKGPIPATTKILERSGLELDEIDVFEVNEAFASVVLAWQRETGVDLARVNPNGGAIALGHPLGCSGARLMTTLLHELERTSGRYGLQLMCEGGGMANATIIERIGA